MNTDNSNKDLPSDLDLKIEEFNEQVEQEAIKIGLKEDPNKKEEELSSVEKEQIEKGWKPKNEFLKDGHSEEDWVPAKQYKRIGEIILAKQDASKQAKVANAELNELSKAFKEFLDKNKKAELKQQELRLEELQRLRIDKIKEGDAEAVYKIENAANQVFTEIQANKVQPTPQNVQEDPRVIDFIQKNKWFTEDSSDQTEQLVREEMRELVKRRANHFEKNDPSNIDGAIADINLRLKTAFPSKFIEERPVSKVSSSDIGIGASKNPKSLFNKLSSEQKTFFKQMEKIAGSYTLDEYIDLLEKSGELGRN